MVTNKKTPMWIFIDDVRQEYLAHYGNLGEKIMINDLKTYLPNFSKTSQIIILTRKDNAKVFAWLQNNKLNNFVHQIKTPEF